MKKRCDTFKEIAVGGVLAGRSVVQVADVLGIAKSALYRWVAEAIDAKANGFAVGEAAAFTELDSIRTEVEGMLAVDAEMRTCLAAIEGVVSISKQNSDRQDPTGDTAELL